jgi:hypothetical protein
LSKFQNISENIGQHFYEVIFNKFREEGKISFYQIALFSVPIKYFLLERKLVKKIQACHQELLRAYIQFYITLSALLLAADLFAVYSAHSSAIIIIPCNRNFALQEALWLNLASCNLLAD